ncbi:MAG: hypothetical protein IT279_12740 [Ignavibacteriaceae bacterium]|nr:hypothetical protein [Ignavibacteriaceae bacterium]
MNTLKLCFMAVFMFLSSLETSAQSDSLIDIFITPEDLIPGEMPKDAQNIHGGKLKTAQGILKVLCVFVRFNGDNVATDNWPNPSVLPSWAENIVDAEIPQNQIYSNLNVSNFFDRSSGGDGDGNLGAFQVIGDVIYITTNYPETHYFGNLYAVNEEIFDRLDDVVDYSDYDNWTFVKRGEYFNHDYAPDGIVDHIFVFHRNFHGGNQYGGYSHIDVSNKLTNDNISITSSSGSTHFNYKNMNCPDAAFGPGHEYGHYLFGGTQVTGHIDGRDWQAWKNWTYNNNLNGWTNYGRVNPFTLMCTGSTGYMSAYEKYRLGWLNPTIIETNTSYINLEDTHVKSKAILIPLEYYAGSSNLKQYYLNRKLSLYMIMPVPTRL